MITVTENNAVNLEVLQTVAAMANCSSVITDDTITIQNENREHSSYVTKTKIEHDTPVNLRCLAVPGKSFFIRSNNKVSVTGNTKHVEGITRLFSTICKEHPRIVTEKFKREIYTMARKVVEIEDAFIDLAFANHNIRGLTKEEIKEYIRYITDRRLVQLGLKPNYGIEQNPISWLDWLTSATQHTNFFEGKVAEYEVAGLQGEIKYEDDKVFEIVSKDGCPFCLSAKELLTNLGYHFTERKINDDTTRNAFYDHYGWQGKERSVPKIFLNGELYAMGFNDLKKKLED